MAQEKQTMYAPKHPPGSELKGGGLRGGPKRWTGNGPRPARHIPWPEIFKHHISVIEGHLKMIDMVRKHTVPNSGNWRTIVSMVERTQEMLRMAKDVSRTFVPPANTREQVPIGSSSASMYPGYSPADHEYGKAAEEFGAQWAAAKAQGLEFQTPPDGPHYEFSQARGVKRPTLAKIRAAKAALGEGSGSGTGSGSDAGLRGTTSTGPQPSGQSEAAKSEDEKADDSNPYFVVDTKPTPVNIPGLSHQPTKRASGVDSPPESASKSSKKVKTKHDGEISNPHEKRVEFEDITGEVDARMKEKEEKRKRKEEKRKRKRESEESVEAQAAVAKVDKPKKKKSKKVNDESNVNGSASKKRYGPSDVEAAGEDGTKKKRRSQRRVGILL
ncbi:hypothetical protein MMC30_004980 [Trapelia coarctata]|nr:hypothetical protein [Trapelia coarctata]